MILLYDKNIDNSIQLVDELKVNVYVQFFLL